LSQITTILGLEDESFRRGKEEVDLLIGIDQAHMHTGKSKQAGQLVARPTPLGWVVFCGPSGKVQESSRILHVKFEMPVDLTDFWRTETMGVAVADKLTQMEREQLQVIKNSCKKVSNQWMVPYPWRKDPNFISNNKSVALKHLVLMLAKIQPRPCKGL